MNTTDSFPPDLFAEVAKVAAEMLSPGDECLRLLQEATKSSDPSSVERALVALRALPTMQRSQIMLTAKQRLRDDRDMMNWIMNRGGGPGDIPPDRTTH